MDRREGAHTAVLWSTKDRGCAAPQVLHAVATGELAKGAKTVSAGGLGKLKVLNGSQVLLGSPLVFTKDNMEKYNPWTPQAGPPARARLRPHQR